MIVLSTNEILILSNSIWLIAIWLIPNMNDHSPEYLISGVLLVFGCIHLISDDSFSVNESLFIESITVETNH